MCFSCNTRNVVNGKNTILEVCSTWFWNVFHSKKDMNVASDVALASLREVVDDLHLC